MTKMKDNPAAAAPAATEQPVTTAVTTVEAAAPAKAKSRPKAGKQVAPATAAAKPVKADKPQKPAKAEKVSKAKKPKVIRDSFTMPESEYAQIAGLKKRLQDKGVVSKKSELLRAGVVLLAGLNDADLVAAAQKVAILKTGRPAASAK